MPIRPEDRARYPDDWPEVSARIRRRSGGRCECRGECRRGHHGHRCRAWHGHPHPDTGSTVVLTVAHLDHTPENCDPANLCAMCQACHLSYDARHHATTRGRTRHAEATRGMDPLFGEDNAP
ncbi:hypothetical protein [Actinomadura macra]|uniref:hypothetical protein n=1 Tax=Actinomadura macra TaxID=46164 RepID=UPI0008347120|nr:hypothetical protein [Actinomadura macra]